MTPIRNPRECHKPHVHVHVKVRKQARMDKDKLSLVEDYQCKNQYHNGISKGDKAHLRC